MCPGNTQVLLNTDRYGQLWPTKGALVSGSQRSKIALTTHERTHGMVINGQWKQKIHRKAIPQNSSESSPKCSATVGLCVSSTGAWTWAEQDSHQQSTCAAPLQGTATGSARRTKYWPIFLSDTQVLFISSMDNTPWCEPPSLLFHRYKHTKQQNLGIKP